jgi:hypothetical protein
MSGCGGSDCKGDSKDDRSFHSEMNFILSYIPIKAILKQVSSANTKKTDFSGIGDR